MQYLEENSISPQRIAVELNEEILPKANYADFTVVIQNIINVLKESAHLFFTVCRRKQICPLYADKLFLPLYGSLMEVSKEDYTEFYRAKRRQKYLDERSADNGDFSYDMLTTDEFSGEDILKLTDEEQLLIYRHYYAGISGTDLAEI